MLKMRGRSILAAFYGQNRFNCGGISPLPGPFDSGHLGYVQRIQQLSERLLPVIRINF